MRRAGLRQARQAAMLLHGDAAIAADGMLCSHTLPSAAVLSAAQCQQQRGLQLFELFSKENRAKRKKRLQEDLQRGYFDDFKELKDTAGKLWRAPDRLIPAEAAQPFPPIQVVRPDKVTNTFPHAPEQAPAASLVCIGFKGGAEEMLASWSDPFVEAFGDRSDAGLVELSVVESQVMALWPFRNMILAAPRRAAKAAAAAKRDPRSAASPTKGAVAAVVDDAAAAEADAAITQGGSGQNGSGSGGAGSGVAAGSSTAASRQDGGSSGDGAAGNAAARGQSGGSSSGSSPMTDAAPLTAGEPPVLGSRCSRVGRLHSEYLFYFGDAYDICRALHITNRLTGYAFLLDRKGRVRFRGCGTAEVPERETLIAAAQQLLEAG